MGKIDPELLEYLNDLFSLEEIGWPMDNQLRECGKVLDANATPKYLAEDLTVTEYREHLFIARYNQIPDEIYKSRLRRGKTPEEAATEPYRPRKAGVEIDYIAKAERNGIPKTIYNTRRRRGWTKERAATESVTKKQPNTNRNGAN